MTYIVCTSNLDLVSFLFVPALYSTLKLEIFPFTCSNCRLTFLMKLQELLGDKYSDFDSLNYPREDFKKCLF